MHNPSSLLTCYVAKQSSLPNWLPLGSFSGRSSLIEKKLDRISSLRRSNSSLDDATDARADNQQYVLPGGGFTIQRGGAHRDPSVYATSKTIVALFGCLSNSDELVERFQPTGEYGNFSPDVMDDPSQLANLVGSISGGVMCDQATLSAELILRLYDVCDGNVLLLLSELQGDYSFVLFDSERRVAVAARNPTGGESLYFYVDDNGAVVITNNVDAVVRSPRSPHGRELMVDEELGETSWQAVPPGHFLEGRRLQQFALTPEQLALRECEEDDADLFAIDDSSS